MDGRSVSDFKERGYLKTVGGVLCQRSSHPFNQGLDVTSTSLTSTLANPPRDPMFENMKALSSALWGHSEAVIKRDDRIGVDYIDLTQYMDAFDYLFGEVIHEHDKILIRDEYRLAMHELETNAMYSQAAYITGHPGIGKTLFFAYVLVSCLSKRRPVAWQLTDGQPFYVLFRDTASLHSLNDKKALLDYGPLWGLSDSNSVVRSPPPLFYKNPKYVKTIQSTPPTRECWRGWSKSAGAMCYVMDIWSEKEMIDLSKLLNLPTERMTTLTKSWGGVPRYLLQYLHMDNIDIERDYRWDARVAVRTCRDAISSIVQRNIVEDGRSNFYFCRPENRRGSPFRRSMSAHVQTPTLCRYLGEALQQEYDDVVVDFFRALSQATHTRQVAEYIYESWFHIYVSAASTMQCHWVQCLDGVSSLTGTSTIINATLDAAELTKPAYYWVAPKNFPGIDSALIFDKAIYAFQVNICSINPRHESPLDGMRALRDHLPADLKDLPWSVVFVGVHESGIEGVARKWVDKVFFPTVSIGWSEVNPVMDWVPYTETYKESDLDAATE